MAIKPDIYCTYDAIPTFVPYGALVVTQDTDALYMGVGDSSGDVPPVVPITGSGGGSGMDGGTF